MKYRAIKIYRSIKNFIMDETGTPTGEILLWLILGVLSSGSVALSYVGALRGKMGDVYTDMEAIRPVSSIVDDDTDYGINVNSNGRTGIITGATGATR
ncbi:hypothetical protein DCCM_2727 [Desulfocucumis palustris]|uniref:Uncharacterized protein n=1 Tax=Desulfocucumis palustris TaxID=1898651 RepID=A0A2L2XIA4_9FIRM|nr:hypothetical protein [Desulfocucumis palustris]GBF33621.1 hypothetical protein DCCM_2727 [Desulfocucumis palustris]